MSVTSAFAIYFVVWWLTLFLVLPFGIRSQSEAGDHVPGSDPGAPVVARIAWRLMWSASITPRGRLRCRCPAPANAAGLAHEVWHLLWKGTL